MLNHIFNEGLHKYKFVPFSDINDFIKKIKDYEWIDGTKLMNEIKFILEDNIKKLPERKEKNLKQRKNILHQQLKNWYGILILVKILEKLNVYVVNQQILHNYLLIVVIL